MSRRPLRIVSLLSAALLLAGCIDVPELGETLTPEVEDAPYPDLLPLETVLIRPPDPRTEAEEIDAELEARRAALERRAAALNAPVVDDPTRSRLEAGVSE